MRILRVLVVGALATSPCAATASDLRLVEAETLRSGIFAGATLRLPLDERRRTPIASLALASYRVAGGSAPGDFRFLQPSGLELGLSRRNAPQLRVGGRPIGEARRRLGVGDTGDVLLVAGGTILLGLAAFFLLADGDDTDCLDPALCN